MASTQRRRVRNQSATAQIVNFFLDQPLEVVRGALELAQTLVARRVANGEIDAWRAPRRAAAPATPTADVLAATPVLQVPADPTPIPLGTLTPQVPPPAVRPRRQRSDAGQSRKRRSRSPIAAAASQAAPRDLPPQDVPLDAREAEPPVEVN